MSNPWTWYFSTVRENYYKRTGYEIPEQFMTQLKSFVAFMLMLACFYLIALIFVMWVIYNG